MHDLKVGDQVIFAPSRYTQISSPNEFKTLTITSIGRKWVYTNHQYRFNKKTLLIDAGGYSQPGKIYLSKEKYLEQIKKEKAWNNIRTLVNSRYSPPENIDYQSLENIAEILAY